MKKLNTWNNTRKQLLTDATFKKEYDALEAEYQMAHRLIKARLAKRMTQQELANKAGVTQHMIAKLESGTSNPTLGTLTKVARVLGQEVRLVAAR